MTNFFLTCKECILESPTNFYGCFYLGPFNSSQSLTVANGLRRTLLSEIPGLGIESIEIEGVEHEFCTFPGIRESILDLLLNFKEIVLKYNNNEQKKIFSEFSPNKEKSYQISKYDLNSKKKPLYGYLQARGPGIIRASDLKLPTSIISVDPNQYIATLTTDGFLNIRFTICEGFTKMQNSKVKYNQLNKNLIEKEFSWLFESDTFKKNENLSNKNVDSRQSNIGASTDPKNQDENLSYKNNNLEKNILSNKKIFKNSKTLWLDPVFTPILKVNYIIESYGSLELNPSNQVIFLELWTNGSIHPRDAVYSALSELNLIFSKLEQMKILNSIFAKSILKDNKFYSKIIKKVKYDYSFYKSNNLKKLKKNLFGISDSSLSSSLLHFSGLSGTQNRVQPQKEIKDANELKEKSIIAQKKITSSASPTSKNEIKKNSELNILKQNFYKENNTIDSLNLPFRIKNSLKNANIISIQNLLNYQIEDLKKIPGIGNQSLILLIKKLNEKGLKLKR
uniref:DNA-directed RNA polymerase n=1 Tax=Pediastrum duplex TaxID=3105 RepID=A0A344PFL4_PEDDU|nr:alpha subunit of RNA polymerase [Pediastrum duplex]QFS20080.1 alpha subunit of RNA polymerase [Pediastrum duplex]